MSDSTANPAHLGLDLASLDLPAWKKAIGGVCAVLLAILFFVSGAWKLSDPFFWSQFFVGDGIFLLMAVLAGLWARASENLRGALVILGAVVVFAGAAFGVNLAHE